MGFLEGLAFVVPVLLRGLLMQQGLDDIVCGILDRVHVVAALKCDQQGFLKLHQLLCEVVVAVGGDREPTERIPVCSVKAA